MKLLKKIRACFHIEDALGYRRRKLVMNALTNLSLIDFRHHRIKILTSLAKISAKKKIEKLVRQVKWVLDDVLSESLQLRDKSTRRMIVYTILKSMKEIHEASLTHGIDQTSDIERIDQYLEKLDIRYTNEAKELTRHMCEMGLYSIKHGVFYAITEFGVLCRTITNRHPESVVVILEYLGKAYDVIQNESDAEVKSKLTAEIIKEIKSAETWNKNHHSGISIKVDELLESKQN